MKRIIITSLLAVGSGLLFAAGKRRSTPGNAAPQSVSPAKPLSREEILQRYMLRAVVPAWIGAGLSDYLWHRRTSIETTAGTSESFMHLVMLAEGAPIVLGASLLEINAGVLALMMTLFFAHEATAMFDVGFTAPRRVIYPGEQHTHSFLEVLPFACVAMLIALYWEQFRALFGLGTDEPRFGIRVRQPHVSAKTVTAVMSAVTIFDVLPHMEELWRCWQATRRGVSGRDTPSCAPELYGTKFVA